MIILDCNIDGCCHIICSTISSFHHAIVHSW